MHLPCVHIAYPKHSFETASESVIMTTVIQCRLESTGPGSNPVNHTSLRGRLCYAFKLPPCGIQPLESLTSGTLRSYIATNKPSGYEFDIFHFCPTFLISQLIVLRTKQVP